mgnify:CR=1 FL=1
MKITKSDLRRIIKEELDSVMSEITPDDLFKQAQSDAKAASAGKTFRFAGLKTTKETAIQATKNFFDSIRLPRRGLPDEGVVKFVRDVIVTGLLDDFSAPEAYYGGVWHTVSPSMRNPWPEEILDDAYSIGLKDTPGELPAGVEKELHLMPWAERWSEFFGLISKNEKILPMIRGEIDRLEAKQGPLAK